MKKIIDFLKKVFNWLKKNFQNKKKNIDSVILGTGQFENQPYIFLKKGNDIFLTSYTKNNLFSQKIIFSQKAKKFITTIKDIHAIDLGNKEYGLVATVEDEEKYKTIYLTSSDSKNFELKHIFDNPNGVASKVVKNDRDEIFILKSVDGEICYINLSDKNSNFECKTTNLGPRYDSFDHGPLKIVGVKNIDDGIFILYEVSYESEGYQAHNFGAALLAHDNLGHIHWRPASDEIPFWENFISRFESDIYLITMGAYFYDEDIKVLFFDKTNKDIYFVDLQQPYARREANPEKAFLTKYINNPILKPKEEHDWERFTVLNPAAVEIENKTHLFYRAEGSVGLSVIGYADSEDGVSFKRYQNPVYVPRMNFEGVGNPKNIKNYGLFKSGYNHYPEIKEGEEPYKWHGTEDPRATEIDGTVYMIYAAYNGYQMARPAITSIKKEDLLAKKWNWKIPQPMTPVAHSFGQGNKNVVLLPEKIDDKYVIFHRIWPNILIDYVDDLEFGPGKRYLKEVKKIKVRGDSWDSHKIAAAAPPIKIDEGWLLIYQGTGSQDRKYKIGAMILDRDDPSKILYRSNYPILTPNQWYENEHKFGVAYPCGVVVKDGILNVYYGAADKYVSLAQAPLKEFVEKLKKDPYKSPKIKKYRNIKKLCI